VRLPTVCLHLSSPSCEGRLEGEGLVRASSWTEGAPIAPKTCHAPRPPQCSGLMTLEPGPSPPAVGVLALEKWARHGCQSSMKPARFATLAYETVMPVHHRAGATLWALDFQARRTPCLRCQHWHSTVDIYKAGGSAGTAWPLCSVGNVSETLGPYQDFGIAI
jgi:hypothetical protein